MLTLMLVSDATGRTVERMGQSALVQFPDAPVKIIRRRQVRTPEQVRSVIAEAAKHDCLILHTLVSDDLRTLMLSEARLQGVDAMDLMGPLLDRLAERLKREPAEEPGLFQQLSEAKSREIEAVDFAFHHDDGANVHELHRAEVVLVGVSRSMKTPTMLYLAYRGWFAANVPIVRDLPLPEELLAMPPERVFCLLVPPHQLQQMRRTRADVEGIPHEAYVSLDEIRREILYAQHLCLTRRWQSIDVTGKSVEEVSREIIGLLRAAGYQPGSST